MKRRYGMALITAGAALVATLGGAANASEAPAPVDRPVAAGQQSCGLDDKLVPVCEGQALFGAWVKGYQNGSFRGQIEEAESRYQRNIDVVHTYHAPSPKPSPIPFGDDKYGDAERYFTTQKNRIVLANFKPGPDFTAAANGAYDDTIRSAARNIRSVAPHKVMLALFHEPENDISGGGECTSYKGKEPGNTPQGYRDMWRHTREIFAAEGATNVVWVMNYMSLERWDCLVEDLWPGNDLVDWVAYDPYSADGSVYTATRFAAKLASLTDDQHRFTDKPYMLAEYGVHSCDARQVHSYYDNLRGVIDTGAIPNLKALVVFDSGMGTGGTDYRVSHDCDGDADPVEEATFARFAAHPRLKPVITN